MVNVDLNIAQVVALRESGQMEKEDLSKLMESFEKEELISFILDDTEEDFIGDQEEEQEDEHADFS